MRLLPLSLTSFLVTCSLTAWMVHPTELAASPEPAASFESPVPEEAIVPRAAPAEVPWAPPDWLAPDTRAELWVLGEMGGAAEDGPHHGQ